MNRIKQRQRDTRRAIYALKRRYGIPATLYQLSSDNNNIETGVKTETLTPWQLDKFVTFDASVLSKFQYSLTFLASNSNFAYGGIFEVGDRVGLVDAESLPKDYVVNKKDYMVFNGKKYEIVKYEELDFNSGYVLHLRHTHGVVKKQIHTVSSTSILSLAQDVGTES